MNEQYIDSIMHGATLNVTTVCSSVSETLTWRSLPKGVIVSKHNLKSDCITSLSSYLYLPHLSSTSLLWRNITINPWTLLCWSQQHPLSEQLFPFSGFAARFIGAVSNLALRYSADSNFTCVVVCRQGIVFLSWPVARCKTKSWIFDHSQGHLCVCVCVCVCVYVCVCVRARARECLSYFTT